MKYIKTFKFWIIFFTLFYTIFGFIFIPWFLTNKTTPLLKEKLGINLEIGKAKFNPYSFNLEINDILLKDLDNKPALGFKKIFIDYMPLGLLEGTLFFGALNIDSPKLYATLEKNGKLNFENLIAPSKQTNSKETEETSQLDLPIITLQKLNINNGHIEFNDLRGEKEFNIDFGPYSFEAHDISTKKDALNAHNFVTKINKDAELFWEGGVRLNPLKLYGEINLKNLKLPSFYTYALPDFDASLNNGKLSFKIPYKVDLSKELKLTLNNANAQISNLVILNKKTDNTITKIPKIELNGFTLKWPAKEIVIKNVNLEDPYVFTLLDKNKELTLVNAFTNENRETKPTTKDTQSAKWLFTLEDTYLKNASITFVDNMNDEPIQTDLTKIALHVKNITLDETSPINFTLDTNLNKGTIITSSGEVIVKPFKLSSNILLKNFDLINYAAYVKPYINLDMKSVKITAKTQLEVTYDKSLNLKVFSDASIDDLLFKTIDKQKLLEWKQLAINQIKYVHNPQELSIKSLDLNEPFIKLHIDEKGKTNFSNIVKETKEVQDEPKKDNKDIMKIQIGPMKLSNGTSDFSDFSLPFPFKTHIHHLTGNLSTIDFQTTTPTKLALTGKIDQYGYADIQGLLLPFNFSENSNINVLFKNIDLTSLTPYSSKFVGYKIKTGKLSMDLKYKLDKSSLVGDNKLNIDTLELGEIVDSPDATSLPLELAIALLKDADGQIDIDMPVKGDMNNPDFSYGGVIWGAVGNMITGIVTAPFRMLGNMLGIDGDELKAIDFDKGSALIISTEHEKLNNIQKILEKRPQLKIDVIGGFDNIYDVKQLQDNKFIEIIKKELELKEKAKTDKTNVYGVILKELYTKQFSQEKYLELEKSFTKVPMNDDNKTVSKKDIVEVDTIAFNDKMKDNLTKNFKISDEDLNLLASKRAKAIKDELIQKYKIDANRVNILEPKIQKAKRDRWIESKLEIAI